MKVALIANLKQNGPTWPDMPPDQWDDLDSWETIQAITIALEKGGHRVTFLEGDKSLYNNLDAVKPDICFNLCRGHFGDSRETQIPAILELLRLPYTGSPVLTLALAMDNPMIKRMLIYHGLPAPAFQVFERDDEPLDSHLQFPLTVKPSREVTDMKGGVKFIVGDEAQLRSQLYHIFEAYHQPALVEQFIEGRQITVGIVGNLTAPIARHIPDDRIVDRTFQGLHIFPPLEVDTAAYLTTETAPKATENRVEDLKWLAAITFRVMGCRDVACIDFQLSADDNNKPYILNVNPLPGLNPEVSNLCLAAKANNWTYEGLINRILDEVTHRHQLTASNSRPPMRLGFEVSIPMSTAR